MQSRIKQSALIESLESRTLFSGAPHAYAPDAVVNDQSMPQWAANWWTKVVETPVHNPDGSFQNPVLDPTGAEAALGNAGNVFYLFGNFSGGNTSRTATLPAGTPIFVPLVSIEFSNYDTAAPDGTLPGNYTAAQLAEMASQSAAPDAGLHLSVDGKALPNASAYREVSPTFSYVLPATDNIDQFFFGQNNLQGPVSPAVADGYYVMLQPLLPGQHTIEFGGTIPPNTPLTGASPFTLDVTYTVNVVPKGRIGTSSQNALAAVNAAAGNKFSAATIPTSIDGVDNLFEKLGTR
jgi:hypothetical protein